MKNKPESGTRFALLRIVHCFLLLPVLLRASPPEVTLSVDGTSAYLDWSTQSGAYYFVQESATLEAGSWVYPEVAVKGDGSPESAVIDLASGKRFYRLEFYDGSVSPLPDVLTANFDGDLADNKTELDQGTDVFGLTFSDADSLFDEWEFFYFGDLSQGDAGNDDTDLTTNREESELGLDPTADESGMALTYAYDDAGRLTAVAGNSTTLAYTLDEEGNITLAD